MNKKSAIAVTVVGIAAIVIAVIGATYAFFRAGVVNQVNNGANVRITTPRLGTITFQNGNVLDTRTEPIAPGWSAQRTFSLQAATDAGATEYNVFLSVRENNFVSPFNLGMRVTPPTGGSHVLPTGFNRFNTTTFAPGTDVHIGTGTITPGTTHNWRFDFELLSIGADQWYDQDKLFSALIRVVAVGDVLVDYCLDNYGVIIGPKFDQYGVAQC